MPRPWVRAPLGLLLRNHTATFLHETLIHPMISAPKCDFIAQLVERSTVNREVVGSSPTEVAYKIPQLTS